MSPLKARLLAKFGPPKTVRPIWPESVTQARIDQANERYLADQELRRKWLGRRLQCRFVRRAGKLVLGTVVDVKHGVLWVQDAYDGAVIGVRTNEVRLWNVPWPEEYVKPEWPMPLAYEETNVENN